MREWFSFVDWTSTAGILLIFILLELVERFHQNFTLASPAL